MSNGMYRHNAPGCANAGHPSGSSILEFMFATDLFSGDIL
jgi:hypothetical protein